MLLLAHDNDAHGSWATLQPIAVPRLVMLE